MTCLNLMVDDKIHNKLAESFVKNKIIIKNFFDSGVASAYGCLTESEKQEGSICIDIGGSTAITLITPKGPIKVNRIVAREVDWSGAVFANTSVPANALKSI